MHMHSAHTLPLPRAAVSATVARSVFSLMASMNVTTALAWSSDRQHCSSGPAGGVSASVSRSSRSSGPPAPSASASWPDGRASRARTWVDRGRMFSSSSMNMQFAQLTRDRMKRSLKRPVTCSKQA